MATRFIGVALPYGKDLSCAAHRDDSGERAMASLLLLDINMAKSRFERCSPAKPAKAMPGDMAGFTKLG